MNLLIIGAGSAGLTAAISAAQNGHQVTVLEKSDRVGGSLWITGGHLSGGGTNRQKERGIVDDWQLHFEDVMRINQNTSDALLTKLACKLAPNLLNWLDDLGMDWVEDTPKIIYGHEPYQAPRTIWGKEKGVSILEALMPLWEAEIQKGNITFLPHHTFKKLLEKDGKVTGVRYQTVKNEGVILADAVILTTGGYGNNGRFFSQVSPQNPRLVSTTHQNAMGNGIEAAIDLGAHFRFAAYYLPTWGGLEIEPLSGRAYWEEWWAMLWTSLYRAPREIYLNTYGKRFLNEDEKSTHKREIALLGQPEEKCWVLFDENARTAGTPLLMFDDHSKFLKLLEEEKIAFKAETIADLATKIGLSVAETCKTVAKYNESVTTQSDEFGRTDLQFPLLAAPFYALLQHGAVLITFGGLQVNEQLQVQKENGSLVPNLYACGEILGAGATSGHAFCSGMLLTPALAFGKYLGENIGK